MRVNWQYCGVFAMCLASLLTAAVAHADDENEAKTIEVKALELMVPNAWEQKPPSNRLRLAEFQIEPAEGEGESELVVYSFGGGGGGIDANIQRWVGQFEPDGRKVKITQGNSDQGDYVLVDLSGTYNQPVGPPIRQQTKRVPDSRMLAVILNVEDEGNYFLKLTGGQKTVTAQEGAFRKSFGGNAENEKPYEK